MKWKERLLRLKLDKITIEEVEDIKNRLKSVQTLINNGKFEQAVRELQQIIFDLQHIINQINEDKAVDVREQLVFAEYHISKALRLALDYYVSGKPISSSSCQREEEKLVEGIGREK